MDKDIIIEDLKIQNKYLKDKIDQLKRELREKKQYAKDIEANCDEVVRQAEQQYKKYKQLVENYESRSR